jgi:methylmalonyl-CoA/ethylmalonyl-CoA epimerase
MDIRLHHIAVAVRSLDDARSVFEQTLGIRFSPAEIVESQNVKVSFADVGGTSIELVQARGRHSPLFPLMDHPILSFLKKYGEGLHHICFEVGNIEETLSRLERFGIGTLGHTVMEGSGQRPVVFLDPNQCHGLLIELREQLHEQE